MSARRCFLSRVIRLNTRKTRSGTFGGLWNTLSTMKLPRNNSSTRIEDEPPSARALRRQILSSKSSLREFCSPKVLLDDDDDAVMSRRLKRAYIRNAVSKFGEGEIASLRHTSPRERENDDGFEVLVVLLSLLANFRCSLLRSSFKSSFGRSETF